MATSDEIRTALVNSIAGSYEERCKQAIGDDLEALYVYGSYAFGKISLDIPDINYFVLLKEGVKPDVLLKHAEILRQVVDDYREDATVMVEFRPFRYIYPTKKGADYEVFICPQLARMEDRHPPVPFGWGWVFQGVLETRKLLFGRDALAQVRQPKVSFDYIKRFFPSTYLLIWLPLERAPMQYSLPEESELLMHEAYKTAQMTACGFGVNLALTDQELHENKWLGFVTDKNTLVRFYEERYDAASARNVELMLEVRQNWLKYRNDPEMAIRMFRAAIDLCTAIKAKYVERFTTPADRETASFDDNDPSGGGGVSG
jgi:hypothetical protein